MLATLLISSLALQVFNFAACVWLLQWRSPGLLVGFVYLMGIIVLPFAMLVGQDNPLSALAAGALVVATLESVSPLATMRVKAPVSSTMPVATRNAPAVISIAPR